MFVEIFSKFQSWHAGTQLWHAAGTQLWERGSARFSFHFIAREGVQGTPAVGLRKPRPFFEDFRPAGRFFSNQQILRLCRTLAGESRTGRFRRRVVYLLEKRGSVVSTPEEGGKRHEVEYLFSEQFF